MKDFGKINDRYEFSFDSRKLGLVLLAAATATSLVFILGVSVGVQWQTKRAENAGPTQAVDTTAEAKPAPQPPAAPPVEPPPVMAVVTTAAATVQPGAGARPSDGAGQPAQAALAKPGTPARDARKEKPAPAASDLTFPKVLSSNNKKTEPLTPAKKPQASSSRYTIQVGAFDDKDSAQARVDKLRKKSFDARLLVSTDKKDRYAYKVRVGSYATREEATATAKKLEGMLQITPYVTAE
ncbi:MAG: SPOR domain-containing protein [Nitrospirae bacterium]|nr:SPOR domain-containing protein [Nitrospirota bacterium]